MDERRVVGMGQALPQFRLTVQACTRLVCASCCAAVSMAMIGVQVRIHMSMQQQRSMCQQRVRPGALTPQCVSP